MELPHLGKNCALKQCNQLDFLPVKCDACSEVFCLRHYQYDTHNCEQGKRRDVQVPVCPLCSGPVPSKRGELPDVAVSQHIDQECRRNERRNGSTKPKTTNLQSCTFKSCKQKDLIYLECQDCRCKFCIKHRHPSDHSCPGPTMAANLAGNWQSFKGSCSTSASSGFELLKSRAQKISKSGQAALNRLGAAATTRAPASGGTGGAGPSQRTASLANSLQGGLSEQEALAIALNESKAANGPRPPLATSNNSTTTTTTPPSFQTQEDEDLALARAIHESQLEASRNRGQAQAQGGSSNRDNCVLS